MEKPIQPEQRPDDVAGQNTEQTTKAKTDAVENLGLFTIEDLAQLGISPYSTIDEMIKKLKEAGYKF